MVAIDLTDVTKTYGDVTALQSVDLTVEDGEVFGFLGPNSRGIRTERSSPLDKQIATDREGDDPECK